VLLAPLSKRDLFAQVLDTGVPAASALLTSPTVGTVVMGQPTDHTLCAYPLACALHCASAHGLSRTGHTAMIEHCVSRCNTLATHAALCALLRR
jgi:hypothetical protein